MYIREGDLFMVAATRSNVNASLVFAFLYQLLHAFKVWNMAKP